MTSPNRINAQVPGADAPIIYYDFTNSLGTGAGNTAGPVAPIEWVIPAVGVAGNAFSKKDWFSYMQSGGATAFALAINTSINNTTGAVMVLNVSVLTS